MSSRREFLKKLGLGGGLLAASGTFAGRVLAANGQELPKQVINELPVPKAKYHDQRLDHPGLPILRLCNKASLWHREYGVPEGHWFVHQYGAKQFDSTFYRMAFRLLEFTGMKAMMFDNHHIGVLPTVTATDPTSEVFKLIVERSEQPVPECLGVLWGPVLKITDFHDNEYELFCSNESMRNWAFKDLGSPYVIQNMILGHQMMSTRHFSWPVPKLFPLSEKNLG